MSRDLVNFLDPRLSATCEISSDGVSDDYYSLDNLISTNVEKRSIGFMTFSVSKPPIEILIKFKWKINMKSIKIHSVLSSLRSTKFQVFIQCSNFDASEIFWRKIGDVSLNDNQIGFCLRSDDTTEPVDGGFKQEIIYPYAKRNLQCVQVIKIVIQDTIMRRAPVLKWIEVWGYPSYKNSKEDTQHILELWRCDNTEDEPEKPKQILPENAQTSFNIPEEFLDSITHDLLVMPFILPSGNVIDETTMEKYNRHEEIYGRLPSDPFTGLIYSSDHQPKFHEVLKTKLDEFKLRNSDEIEVKQSGRTLGTKLKPVASTSSFYNSSGHISKKIKLNGSSTDLNSLISSIYKNKQVSVFTKPKVESPERSTCCPGSLNFYRISNCNHLICKTCLLLQGNADSRCAICQTSFQSKDITKVNL